MQPPDGDDDEIWWELLAVLLYCRWKVDFNCFDGNWLNIYLTIFYQFVFGSSKAEVLHSKHNFKEITWNGFPENFEWKSKIKMIWTEEILERSAPTHLKLLLGHKSALSLIHIYSHLFHLFLIIYLLLAGVSML